MQRIMIIGGPGSGKSTLARKLGQAHNLPVFHMDREVHWLPGWQERPSAEKTPIVQAIVAQDRWVFEGGHSTTYPDRLARADCVVWLDLPLGLCLWRVLTRTIRDRGKTRPDSQDNCPERLDMLPEFFRFILRTRNTSRAKKQTAFEAATCPKHHLRTRRDVAAFVETMRC